MRGKKSLGVFAGGLLLSAVAARGQTVVYTAGTVSTLDPSSANTTLNGAPYNNPQTDSPQPLVAPATTADAASNGTLTDGATLSNFQILVSQAYANNTGGVMNFEEVDEGGGHLNDHTTTYNTPTPEYSWPSQANSTNNGFELGNGSANAVQVNYGASQPTSAVAYSPAANVAGVTVSNTLELSPGTNSITFWRDLYTANGGVPNGATTPKGDANPVPLGFTPQSNAGTTQTNTADGFDANNGENNSGNTGVTPASGNSYVGMTNDGSPVVLDFTLNPLVAFGVTATSRNSTRPLRLVATLNDGSVVESDTESTAGTGTTNNIFYGFDLTQADLALHGGIIYVTFDTTTGSTDRFDDIGFVVAPTPEPASLGLLAFGALPLLRRRRKQTV